MSGPRKKDLRLSRPYAKKSLGQNFLVDESYASRIVAALGLDGSETVIEIGPGRGALTALLADKAGRVVGIEIDRHLAPELSEQFAVRPSVEIIEADFLELDPSELTGDKPAKVAANLPYYISTAILRRLCEFRSQFSCIVVMLQKEVAERLVAPAGSSERGYLTVFIEHAFHCEKLFDVPPGAFRPIPKVESSVVRLTPVSDQGSETDDELFRRIVSAGFAQKRKTLANNLRSAEPALKNRIESAGGARMVLITADVDENARAEDLSAEEWAAVAAVLGGKQRPV